jgi:hypothetical protein
VDDARPAAAGGRGVGAGDRVSATEIARGLLRWTAPHPDWPQDVEPGHPDYWEQEVGSALYELTDLVVLFDPLLPRVGRDAFLQWLDQRIAGRAVSILTTIRWHRRDREELAGRYRSTRGGRAWNAIPPGVSPKPLRGAGETMYWLPGVAALIVGDRLLGADGGGLRLCPESWLEGTQVDRRGLALLMRPLLELPIERVLVSHGEPVLHDGRAALARAIDEAGSGAGG